jgi:hypothetical protein
MVQHGHSSHAANASNHQFSINTPERCDATIARETQ